MKISAVQCLAAISFLSTTASAIPLFWPAKNFAIRAAQPQQSYSVVPVDGGSSTGSAAVAPATMTVTDAVTSIRTATILSTVVATPTNAPLASLATSVIAQTVTFATTATPSPATVTIQPSVTSVPFDNGQWHTTYYFTSTMSGASGNVNAAGVASSPSPAPTASVDLGQWAYWAQKDGQSSSAA